MAENNKPTTRGFGKTLGASGTTIFGGYITAEEYNRKLTGKSAIRQYEIMRRSDTTVHQAVQVCILPLTSAIWDVEAVSEDEADQYVARFVKRELMEGNINWTAHVRESGGMLYFGYAVAEKTYYLTEFENKTRIGIKELSFRKQVSIEKWETEDKKPGITQLVMGDQKNDRVGIPMEKLVVYTNEREGDNYEGISVLRYAFKDWDMKDKLGRILAIGLEKMAIPVPVLGIPEGKDGSEEVANAIEALRQWRANEEAFIKKPHGWELDKLDMSGQSTKEILPTLQYYDRQIVRSVLAQFLEIGASGSSGSFAASDNQSDLYIKSLVAIAENIRATAQEQIIKQLCDLNFTELPNGYPKLKVSRIGEDDMQKLAEAVGKFNAAGLLTPTFETEQHLRSITNLPALPDDYKDDFDEKRQAAKDASAALKEVDDDSIDDDDDKKTDPKESKKDKSLQASAALRNLKRSHQRAIDIIVRQ